MVRLFLALIAFFLSISASADQELVLHTRQFAYPASLVADMGPNVSPIASIVPTIDRSRAYLLDISEAEIIGRPEKPVRNAWDRVRNGFSLAPLKTGLVAEREQWYRQRKDLVLAISQKARRYLHHIVEAVEKRGLPTEIALLPFVESGFEPQALSSAQAAGLWQFIPGTAQRYHLQLNEHYDARRDIVASTQAALNYLEFLHGLFQDWHLAFAAYNWGEEAVQRAILRNQARGLPTDYESLAMPEETRYYVPKLMAIRNIVADPEHHGILLAEIDNVPYFSKIEVAHELDAQAVAGLAGLTVAEVLALNPSHKSQHISGRGKPAVLLPTDAVGEFSSRLSALSLKVKAVGKRSGSRKAIIGLRRGGGMAL
ncbi:MAG: transglycosylase SLT domain-containing protein [Rhodocyclales bacterium]|nr:transglycosylase SLT domain-containing protein [Rhodocyclales bacterium]